MRSRLYIYGPPWSDKTNWRELLSRQFIHSFYDRAFGPLACESCAVIDRAYSKNADVTSLCVAKAGGFPYSLLFLSRPIPSPD